MLGAAGVLTVAIGFASQTAASNFVSGLFLVVENPFSVGDVIRVDDTTGEVLSIDWLSVELRTFDNLLVRIPNETLVKSKLTNLNRFPIRRADLRVGVAYKEDLARVQEVLLDLADRNPLSLEEPAPLVILLGFGDSSVDIQFSVWGARENFLGLRTRCTEPSMRASTSWGSRFRSRIARSMRAARRGLFRSTSDPTIRRTRRVVRRGLSRARTARTRTPHRPRA